jgi:ATP-dependent DNA helicase RecG
MFEHEIHKIIEKGEGISVEFKTAGNNLPENLFETVCAFLNRNGGTIILGIEDNKNVTGIDPAKVEIFCKDFASLSNNHTKIEPVFLLHPKVVDYRGKKLIHVFVPASSSVHKSSGKVFDRSVEGDFVVKFDNQISQIYLRKSSLFSESFIYPYLNETHFEEGIVEKSKNIMRANRPNHPWVNLSNDEFFNAAGLFRYDIKSGEKGFTLAALMLFGKEEIIQSALPHYKIDALLRHNDLDRYDDRENIRCNLITAYEILMSFVAKHLPDKFYLEGDRRISLREKIFREIIASPR